MDDVFDFISDNATSILDLFGLSDEPEQTKQQPIIIQGNNSKENDNTTNVLMLGFGALALILLVK